jgi:threonylcarbamoyladenosine tRNA methylthiotransferase MtaB
VKVAITTLGCKVNQYDSASLSTLLQHEGHTLVAFEPGADAYIVNSCTITDRADVESRGLARRAKRWNPGSLVIMTGCYAQTNPTIASRVPEVDFVIGLSRREDLLRALAGEGERMLVDDLRKATRAPLLGAETFGGRTRAFLKVQDGCDLFCTFCIVPWSRGRSRSVPPREILGQLEHLANRGFQEVVLTGIHLGGYGIDLRPKMDLADLVEMIAERPIVPRVRLSSIDPPEVSESLLRVMKQSEVLCPHLHVPVQAVDDTVLRRMRRRYDTMLVRDVAQQIRAQLPDAALGTDVIAGFPGETSGQFQRTAERLADLPFTYFHVFPYSRRTGTTAAKLAGHMPRAEILARARALRKLGERKKVEFAARFVGERLRVLPEQKRVGGAVTGYARNYVRVRMVSAERLGGEVNVRVRSAHGGIVEATVEDS